MPRPTLQALALCGLTLSLTAAHAQVPLLPGTGDGLTLSTGLNGAPPNGQEAKAAAPGDSLSVALATTGAGLDGAMLFLALGFGPLSSVPTPTLPGVALDLTQPFVSVPLGALTPSAPASLETLLGPGLSNSALFLQGIALPLDPSLVGNGLFAASDGHRIDVADPAGPLVVNEDLALLASDTVAGDNFGFDVDLRGGRIAIGAPFADNSSLDDGSAYLFDLETGAELGKVTGGFGFLGDNFGNSVVLTENTLFVGVPRDDASTTLSGSIRRFSLTTGQPTGQILPMGSQGESPVGHSLGEDIAVAGGLLVSGARGDSFLANGGGSAQVFDAGSGAFVGKLFPSDPGFADNFGSSVGVTEGLIAVGSPFDDLNGDDSGSAYLFDAATGVELFKIEPTDTGESDLFGEFVALDGDVLLVGAPFLNDSDGIVNAGAAYVYRATTGELLARLESPSPIPNSRFGDGLALDGDLLLIGESGGLDSNGVAAGVVHVFDRATLAPLLRLEASAGAAGDALGESIAIEGQRVVVGARGADGAGNLAGTAYLFTLP